jgi:hypothetical protein
MNQVLLKNKYINLEEEKKKKTSMSDVLYNIII